MSSSSSFRCVPIKNLMSDEKTNGDCEVISSSSDNDDKPLASSSNSSASETRLHKTTTKKDAKTTKRPSVIELGTSDENDSDVCIESSIEKPPHQANSGSASDTDEENSTKNKINKDNDDESKGSDDQPKKVQVVLAKLLDTNSLIEKHNLREIRDQKNKVIATKPSTSAASEEESDSKSVSNRNSSGSDSDDEASNRNGRKKIVASDSDREDSPPVRRKRPTKRKKSDSDSDVLFDDDEDEELREAMKQKRKRKRIKKVADSSDEDGNAKAKKKKDKTSDASDDDDGTNKGGTGRKNIRAFKGTSSLEETTKRAAKEEKQRLERLVERQRIYNALYQEEEGADPLETKTKATKLILDFDQDTKEILLEVDKGIVAELKPHQCTGIKFMFEACFESIERIQKSQGSGCILAHCMGLGKTLQVVGLVHTLLSNSDQTKIERVLVVSPLSTVLNWENEFDMWCAKAKSNYELNLFVMSKQKQTSERAYLLKEWYKDGGVMIMGYDMFRLMANLNTKVRKKLREQVAEALLDPGPDLIICDEGHLLKNEKTAISKAMMKLRSRRRIVLTGTPLQNNLKEYYCMVQFVKPNLLGSYKEYLNRFVNPITNGQYVDSTDLDIKVMRRRAHVLHTMLEGCVQRRDYSVLAPFLPKKHEYVVSIKLTPLQIQLYKYYMEHRPATDTSRKAAKLFSDFQNLQRVWTHPRVLRYNSDRYAEVMAKQEIATSDDSDGSLREFVVDSDEDEARSTSSDNEDSDDEKPLKETKRVIRTRNKAAEDPNPEEDDVVMTVDPERRANPTEWWMQMVNDDDLDKLEHSSKLVVLFSILQMCESIGDKLLVFTQSLYSLDVIEHFLRVIDDQTQAADSHTDLKYSGSWSLGLDYFRLDGSTKVEHRNSFCKQFNDEKNTRSRLFLISTRAGGLGINLVAANRVIIFDVSWNPSHDIQSIFRIYRFGQKKPCYIYRFVALGTMEEKIYERQVTKEAISKRVIDEQQIDRHYRQEDIMELYATDLEPEKSKEIPLLPKDRLFADILTTHGELILRYHEHDSLLENKEEETLDEDERKAAWDEFNNEKERRVQVNSYGTYSGLGQKHNGGPAASSSIFGINSNVMLLLLQQKIRVTYPYYTQQQINQAVPLLMQELYRQMNSGEITLYQELLDIQNAMIGAAMSQQSSQMYQASGYANNQQVDQYQQQLAAPTRKFDPNEVVEID